jgi:UDPglucose 6-dehydrogenase
MKNAVVGVGRLGLPLLLNFERFSDGEWVGYDINSDYISQLNSKNFSSFEPGVNDLLKTASCSFTDKIDDILDAEIVFLCVRTNSVETGQYDVQNIFDFIERLEKRLVQRTSSIEWLVVNCNVNPGTSMRVLNILEKYGINVCFWPEWVKQGSVVADQMFPAVHVLGFPNGTGDKEKLLNVIAQIDQNVTKAPTCEMSLFEAELTKITLNCFLTVKISYANMIGHLAERLGLNADRILSAVGLDPRIGSLFFKPGAPYGGPCFPRDTKALIAFGELFGVKLPLVEAAEQVNAEMVKSEKIRLFSSSHASNRVFFEHLDFKKGTNIFSGSPNLLLAQFLNELGVEIELACEFKDQENLVYDKRPLN